ncbi:kinase-like domain-containing protein, partial [Mycena galopus ATCC 62051]
CKEALIWQRLDHPNIARFMGVDFTTLSPAMAMITRWLEYGNVISYIRGHSPCSPYAARLLRECIAGLEYLHSENILHGDLRGYANVLVDEDGHACLTDFGLAIFIDSESSGQSSRRGGTIPWMAPELLLPSAGEPARATRASDMWAFGLLSAVCVAR